MEKEIKKKLEIIIVVLFVIVGVISIIVVIPNEIEKGKFVGTWTLSDGGGRYYEITFNSDNTATLFLNPVGLNYSATYSIKDGKYLIFDAEGSRNDWSFNYEFKDDKTLILTETDSGDSGIYTKS